MKRGMQEGRHQGRKEDNLQDLEDRLEGTHIERQKGR